MQGIEGQGKSDLRTKLLQLYDSLPQHEAFKDLDIADFTFVDKAKKKTAQKIEISKILQENVKLTRAPPPSKKPRKNDPFVDNDPPVVISESESESESEPSQGPEKEVDERFGRDPGEGSSRPGGSTLGGGAPRHGNMHSFGGDGAMDNGSYRFDANDYQNSEE